MKITTGIGLAVLASLLLAVSALGNRTIGEGTGSGPGQTMIPKGLAIDGTTGSTYVADEGNNRIDVFSAADGSFQRAIGWGVINGLPQLQVCTSICRQGLAGAEAGQLNAPEAIAFDDSSASHAVYVYERPNARIEKFTPAGEFVLMLGKGVNKTTGGDICTAASGNTCGAGAEGSGPGDFADVVQLAVGLGGSLYAAGGDRVQKFEPSGSFAGEFSSVMGVCTGESLVEEIPTGQRTTALAVDSSGKVYVATGSETGGIREYGPDGTLLNPCRPLNPSTNIKALGVDSSDNLFVTDEGPETGGWVVTEYDSGGATIRRFGYGSLVGGQLGPVGVAAFHAPDADVFVLDSADEGLGAPARIWALEFPAPGPIAVPGSALARSVGNVKATVQAKVNPEGTATTYHFEYLDNSDFERGGFENPATEKTPESPLPSANFAAATATAQIAGLTPETTYHFRAVAESNCNPAEPDEECTAIGQEGTFTTLRPLELGATWATAVTTDSATLQVEVNPLGIPTQGHFQYVSEATFEQSGFAQATDLPNIEAGEPAIDFGSGEAMVPASAKVSGLAAGTSYHYRFIAGDAIVSDDIIGEEHVLTTFSPPLSGEEGCANEPRRIAQLSSYLPECRAFEQVSPAQKESAELGIPTTPGGIFNTSFKPQQSATDGEGVTYGSFTAFGAPVSAPAVSQYLSRRTAEGWATENITPPDREGYTRDPLRGFSSDLSKGVVAVREPVLASGALEGFETLYVRDSGSGALTTVTTEEPQDTPQGTPTFSDCLLYGGASTDFDHVIFASSGSYAGVPGSPKGTGFRLYEWSPDVGVKLVSVLPSGAAGKPSAETGFGQGPGPNGCRSHNVPAPFRGAISKDGSKIFWTDHGSSPSRLIARINGRESVQLDARQGGPGTAGGGKFWAASSDGSKVFFTDASQLTSKGSRGGEDLYEYDFNAPEKARLTDLTIDEGESEGARVQGILGASEDGAYVYLVALGVLDEAPNHEGKEAVAGQPNLYVWSAVSSSLRFIATLAPTEPDMNDWFANGITSQAARAIPDGTRLAFLSKMSLTGYDNVIASGASCSLLVGHELSEPGDPRCAEVYLYDAQSGQLSCASCNPSGGRPVGPAVLPGWSSPFEQPRYLSDDGDNLFFETLDSLSPADINHRRDIYEFVPAGAGGCASLSTTFSQVGNGCIGQITPGTGSDDTYLIDAGSEGRDVFFTTRQQLVPQDEDENYDVYDARVGGGFETAARATPCSGEACRPPQAGAPAGVASKTGSLAGPGNVKRPRMSKPRCAKKAGKAGARGRRACVKKPKHTNKKHAKKKPSHKSKGRGKGQQHKRQGSNGKGASR